MKDESLPRTDFNLLKKEALAHPQLPAESPPEKQRGVGRVNPISVEGKYFHNLKFFREVYGCAIGIKSRTLTQRVANLKARWALQQSETLVLNREDFIALISLANVRLPFAVFEVALTRYISRHDLQLVRGGGRDDPASIDPITNKEAYEIYANNRTPIYFRCNVCISNGGKSDPFHKSLDHWDRQGCPDCGDQRSVDRRRLQPDEVRTRIASHAAGIDWVGEGSTYRDNKSPLSVICRSGGHEITRPAEDFFEYGSFMSCPDCTGGRLGESIALGVVNFLLNTGHPAGQARELTPPHLSGWNGRGYLRHDGYFEVQKLGLKIAVEHMGDQHTNPDNPHHSMSKAGKVESFRQTKERDDWKRTACNAAQVSFVDVPDLVVNCTSLVNAANLVANALISKTNAKVLKVPGFEDRVCQLDNEKFVRGLIITSGRLPPENRLQKQLDEEKSPVSIVAFNPMTNFFTLTCRKHADQGQWQAKASNAIGSDYTDRKGTRCPKCGPETRGVKRRLTEIEIDAHAEKLGFKRKFSFESYKPNGATLTWECLKNPDHVIDDSLGHLQRGCKFCRNDEKP
jgi:hypothetical protein